MPERPRVALTSLGCKQNACEAEGARQAFIAAGYRSVDFGEPAEVYLIFTCTVTARADYRSRNLLRRAARCVLPGGRVVACGCYAVTDNAELAGIEGVTDIAPGDVADLPRRLGLIDAEGGSSPSWPSFDRSFRDHTRGFLSVQDGCDGECSYCKVRLARGAARSRPLGDAHAGLRRLVEAGHREVVLTGIHLGAWGRGEGRRLDELVERLLETDGLQRLRLSSIEPPELSDELLDLIGRSSGRVAPHLHIPLQSGSDDVLRRMNRRYTSGEALGRLLVARETLPGLGLGLDVMVGFPGETEEDFQSTRRLILRAEPTYLHVFSFSARPGTPAATFGDTVDEEAKSRRSRDLRLLSTGLARRAGELALGRRLHVLIERRGKAGDGLHSGISGEYLRCDVEGCRPEDAGNVVPVEVLELLQPAADRPTAGPARLLCRRSR